MQILSEASNKTLRQQVGDEESEMLIRLIKLSLGEPNERESKHHEIAQNKMARVERQEAQIMFVSSSGQPLYQAG